MKMKTATLIIVATISSVATVVAVSAKDDVVNPHFASRLFDFFGRGTDVDDADATQDHRFLVSIGMSLPKTKAAKAKGSEDGGGLHHETMSSDEKEAKVAKGHKVF